jgi:3-deoxy-manno-octulosonate cytidylyltransferase (CMP-KDO synthetase)
MKFIGIIPARYESTRFPGKPLVDIHGISMIQRVYEQCLKAKLDQVIIATDDSRIYEHVKSFRGEVVMTSTDHQSGTDRIAEAANKLNLDSESIIINIQGDEPFINPKDIDQLGKCFTEESVQIATLVKKITDSYTLNSPNTPKVVLGTAMQALYFSREAIPHLRGVERTEWLSHQNYYQHIGIYAFKLSILNEITKLSSSHLEQSEGLEQLRWLENGYTIHTSETESDCVAVDSPEDLKRIDEKFFS